MVSNDSNLVVTQHFALVAPIPMVVDQVSTVQVLVFPKIFHSELEAMQHSPPELYALHSSLLI